MSLTKQSTLTAKVWEKQHYETDISFRYFQKYYLMQTHPRSLTRGYRRYLEEKRKYSKEKAEKKNAPGNWQQWFRGQNTKSKKAHPDALTWPERAEAYDEWVAVSEKDRIINNRNELLNSERDAADKQLQLWDFLFDAFKDFLEKEKMAAISENRAFDPIPFIMRAKDLLRMREDIAVFSRRILLLPDKYHDDQYDDADDIPAEINWKEVEFDPEDIGVGREELMELMKYGKKAD